MTLFVWSVIAFILIWTYGTTGNEDSTKSLDPPSYNCTCEPQVLSSDGCTGAVYFATNNKLGNWVIVSCIQPDGTLLFNNTISTRGNGSSQILQYNLVDNVITGDNFLFVANSGSDSVSMFNIDPQNPQKLAFVTSVNSQGNFPACLAYSSVLKVICVLNAGKINNIACFKVTPTYLTPLPNTVKSVGKSAPNPPPLFNSVSDIIFSANSKQIVVSVKGGQLSSGPVLGSIVVFSVSSGGTVLGDPVINNITNSMAEQLTLVPTIGNCSNTNQQNLIYTAFTFENTLGLGLFVVPPSGIIDTGSIVHIPIPGRPSSGWSKFSPRTGILYTTDTGTRKLIETKIECLADGTLNGVVVKQYPVHIFESDLVIVSLPIGDILYTLGKSSNTTLVNHVYSLGSTPGNVTLIQDHTIDNAIIVDQTGQPLDVFRQGIAAFLAQPKSGCSCDPHPPPYDLVNTPYRTRGPIWIPRGRYNQPPCPIRRRPFTHHPSLYPPYPPHQIYQ